MLQEFCDTRGYHRKHAIRTLNEEIHFRSVKFSHEEKSSEFSEV